MILLLHAAGCGTSTSTPSGRSYDDQVAAAKAKDNPDIRAFELIRIGYQQGKKGGDALGSAKTLEAADMACSQIDDRALRADKYTLLADAYYRLGNRLEAAKALNDARTAAEAVEPAAAKPPALAAIAAVYSSGAQNEDEAIALFTIAEQAAEKIEDSQARALALKEVAKSLIKAKQTARGEKALAKATESARVVQDARQRGDALAQIAAVQMTMSDKAVANATLEAALESARQIESLYSRVYALTDIAEQLIDAKQKDSAGKVIGEAESLVKKIPQLDLQEQAEARVSRTKTALAKLK